MIAKKEDSEPTAEQPLPNSRKVYVAGKQLADGRVRPNGGHVDLRVQSGETGFTK